MPSVRLVLILGVIATLASCATPSQIVMEPMVLMASGERSVDILDEDILFDEGNEAFGKLDYEEALHKYALLLQHFPRGELVTMALYNQGLAHQRLSDWASAAKSFARYIPLAKKPKDIYDGYFRLIACHEELGHFVEMKSDADAVLGLYGKDLTPAALITMHTLRGRASEGMKDWALSERDFREAWRIYKAHLEQDTLQSLSYVSEAQYRLGGIYQALFSGIHFRLPPERMARDFEEKSVFFLEAQKAYLQTLRLRHPNWATRAGYQLGKLFERMHGDMLEAEIPDDLSEEELAVYWEEINSKIRHLLDISVDIFERNLRMADRLGQRDEWVEKSKESLARLKASMEKEAEGR